MQTLGAILSAIDSLDPELVIVAPVTRPLAASSPARVVEPDNVPTEGELAYLLEVALAREVIEIWASWRAGVEPSIADSVRAVAHYADHDAYLPLESS
jgi:hypothetical protein